MRNTLLMISSYILYGGKFSRGKIFPKFMDNIFVDPYKIHEAIFFLGDGRKVAFKCIV